MYNDFVVEADGKLAIGGVTHLFHIALGSDDPEHNELKGSFTIFRSELIFKIVMGCRA